MVMIKPITADGAATFREVRLRALFDSPTAFGATYASESQFSDADWERRAAQWNGERSTAYLAWDASEPCGIVAGFVDVEDPRVAHLVSMWVAPTHRRHGIGRLLVNAVIQWAATKQAHSLRLHVTSSNTSAIQFYGRLGFTMTGRTERYLNDASLVEYEMSRAIECGDS